jgi:hypothetical protein
MFQFLAILVSLAVLYGLVTWLARVDIRSVSRAMMFLLPTILLAFAVTSAIIGRPVLGAVAASIAALLVWRAKRRSHERVLRTPAIVRSPWLEVQIERGHTGLDGVVLAGKSEGRRLSSLDSAELLALYIALQTDQESRELLEAYLDSHAAAWRDNPQFDVDRGQGTAPRTGTMADEEAYQILGLEPGASAADIRKAHRRLSQGMRGNAGSLLLLNRIDEARDILLARHH